MEQSREKPSSPSRVELRDWWLIEVDAGGLGVEGAVGFESFASRTNSEVKFFKSKAISIRHDTAMLETKDGVTVLISGLINIERTIQKGLPPTLCSIFMYGFPFNWEDYASAPHFTPDGSDAFSGHFGNDSSLSLNDLPATTINSLLRSTLGHPSYDSILKNICSDLLTTCSEHDAGASQDPKAEDKCSAGRNRKRKSIR